MSRQLSVKLKSESGTINRFQVFVDQQMVIAEDGNATAKWSGKAGNAHTSLKVRVMGIDDASYSISISLEGSIDDQKLVISLAGGYHEFELVA